METKSKKKINDVDFFTEFPQMGMFLKVLKATLKEISNEEDKKLHDGIFVLVYSPETGKVFHYDEETGSLSKSFDEHEAEYHSASTYIIIATNKSKEINQAILWIFLYAINLLGFSTEIDGNDFFSKLEQNSSVFFVEENQMLNDRVYP